MGLPTGLDTLQVTPAMMEVVAGEALEDHCHATNPRRPTRADYLTLLRDSR